MSNDQASRVQAAADRELELAEEVETSGHAHVDGEALEKARAALHAWVDGVKGVVINAALGRVTVIHENGRASTISSPDLPFAMSSPVKPRSDA
ncbi:hypothetical protein LJR219_003367 [Phenylobacterium sp. LjRoot219]|uniref:hypothetical protein n=1 Tax=Phenylobacterium sp. LjRoot219 TaxID=3342283 RepID=UPI003ED0800D